MPEKLVERLSDTESIVEGIDGTSNYFAHVFRHAPRTKDDWTHCCKASSVDELRACPYFRKGQKGA